MDSDDIRILIVDDEEDLCAVLSQLITKQGFKCLIAHEGETALKMVYSQAPDVLLLDFKMPGMNGMEVLQKAHDLKPDLPVVMITAFADIPGAVSALKAGVYDYLAKPFENSEVIRVIQRALSEGNLKKMIDHSFSENIQKSSLRILMGPSDHIFRLTTDVNRVAKSDFNVIILGETGSGKELVARNIHQESSRAKSSFVPVDCGAIPETLFESELFGYEKGAFTGAEGQRKGKYEIAHGGTLFLDEILNMPSGSQSKLLRVLQEKEIYRVGATRPVRVDVRVLVACNQELEEQVEAKLFREDLYFRLNEFIIKIPPLRDRKEDILYLAKRFLDLTNMELKKKVERFSDSAREALLNYEWPGNVRQLRSVIRRAVLLANDIISTNDLDLKSKTRTDWEFNIELQGMPWKEQSLKEILSRNKTIVEREVLFRVLRMTQGNKAKAARLLKIDYKTIHTKTKQFGFLKDGGEHEAREG